jgi:hypothetical protein
MKRAYLFLMSIGAIILLWYLPKIRAAKGLTYRPLLPQLPSITQGAFVWQQPIIVTNARNNQITIQNVDFRVRGQNGTEYAQATLPQTVTIGGNTNTQISLLVQIPIVAFPAIVQQVISEAKQGIARLIFAGSIRAEGLWIEAEPFTIDIPTNFFKK